MNHSPSPPEVWLVPLAPQAVLLVPLDPVLGQVVAKVLEA
jgi:hypothetical protein